MPEPSDTPTPVEPPDALLEELASYQEPVPVEQQPLGDALLTVTVEESP
ncbi:hypothetical protein [Streptomyces sp. WG-D5]